MENVNVTINSVEIEECVLVIFLYTTACHYLFDCRKYGKEFKRMRTVRYVHVKCILPLSTISIPIPFKMCLTRYYNRQFVGGKNVSVLTGTGSVRNVAKSG